MSDNMNMDGNQSESESDDEIIVFERPLASVSSSAASTKIFSQEHNQKSHKRKLSDTQIIKSKPSTGSAISSGKPKRVRKLRKVKSWAMEEAERIQSSLNSEFPSFIKNMRKSFVEGNSIKLSHSICGSHLPKEETMITLEDENKKKFQVKYFPNWTLLSKGWRSFVDEHKLRESDVLLFHLIENNRFKVYIIRARSKDAFIPGILNLDEEEGGSKSPDEPTDPSEDLRTFEVFRRKVGSGLLEESAVDENTLKKYYKLCSCKNVILHDKTFSDRNSKLKAGVIGEVVNIADAVKTCSIFTPREKLEEWENSLKLFKLLGMKVEFIVNRVSQLMKLRDEYEGTRFEDELKKLEVQRVEMMEAYTKFCNKIDKMRSKVEGHKVKFQELVDSHW